MSAFPIPRRVERAEYLDLGYGSVQDVAANLADMHKFNRIFGGTRALSRHLYPRLSALDQPVRLLDLGTGSGSLPVEIARWARRQDKAVQVVGMDWALRNLSLADINAAHGSGVYLVCADAARLPLEAGAVDFITSTLFLHHLSPPQVIDLLRKAFNLSRCGILMSDLIRGWLPYFFARLLLPLFSGNYLSRHDGPLSVRRAYTPAELLHFAREAGLPNPEVHSHWPWRMTLVADK